MAENRHFVGIKIERKAAQYGRRELIEAWCHLIVMVKGTVEEIGERRVAADEQQKIDVNVAYRTKYSVNWSRTNQCDITKNAFGQL